MQQTIYKVNQRQLDRQISTQDMVNQNQTASQINPVGSHPHEREDTAHHHHHHQPRNDSKIHIASIIRTIKTKSQIGTRSKISSISGNKDPFGQIANKLSSRIRAMSKMECGICLGQYQKHELSTFGKCNHFFCEVCSLGFITQSLNDGIVAECPSQECDKILSEKSLWYLRLDERQKTLQSNLKTRIEVSRNSSMRLCQEPDCIGYFSVVGRRSSCVKCKTQYCSNCASKYHQGQCRTSQTPQYKKIQQIIRDLGFRTCSKCRQAIERTRGCDHITCPCGYQFCYKCQAEWALDPCRRGLTPGTPVSVPYKDCFCLLWPWRYFWSIPAMILWAVLGLLVLAIIMLVVILCIVLWALVYGPFDILEKICSKSNQYDKGDMKIVLVYLACIVLFPLIILAGVILFIVKHIPTIHSFMFELWELYCDRLHT